MWVLSVRSSAVHTLQHCFRLPYSSPIASGTVRSRELIILVMFHPVQRGEVCSASSMTCVRKYVFSTHFHQLCLRSSFFSSVCTCVLCRVKSVCWCQWSQEKLWRWSEIFRTLKLLICAWTSLKNSFRKRWMFQWFLTLTANMNISHDHMMSTNTCFSVT